MVDPQQIVVVASDFGEQRSATTTRYLALAAAAERAQVEVLVVNQYGLTTPSRALLPIDAPRANQRSLPERVLRELWAGLSMAWRIPRGGTAIVGMPPVVTALLVCSALRILRRRYWLDVRDLYPDVLFAAGVLAKNSLGDRALRFWIEWTYEGAERLVAATEDIAKRLERRTSRPVSLVRNGFGGRFAPHAMPDISIPILSSHGTLGRFQNSELLAEVVLEARRRGLPWKFLVIGDGPNAAPLSAAEGPTLTWHRFASQETLPHILSETAIGMSFRTRDEISAGSIPVRMLEYLGLGVPVLVHPDSEGGAEIAANSMGEVVDDADAGEIVDRLQQMLEPKRYEALRRAVLERRDNYSGPSQWAELLANLHRPAK
ncbi:MAG: glycosyltransferase [Gemmatimonadota bacterium]|nr:glycosyltransferase [Gemmatimonadota bacterium]